MCELFDTRGEDSQHVPNGGAWAVAGGGRGNHVPQLPEQEPLSEGEDELSGHQNGEHRRHPHLAQQQHRFVL